VTSPNPITFVDVVVSGFRNATNFAGKASRAEFWYWVLFAFLVRLVTTTVDAFIYPEDITLDPNTTDLSVISSELATAIQHSFASSTFLLEIALLLPTIALTTRRFRDAGWKPWLAWGCYAGIYGSLVVSLVIASQLLSVLTVAGAQSSVDIEIAVGFLVILGALLVQISSFIVILVGTLQRSKNLATD
jgi:uncharacterized membrane protein YhaH (DUF805 family)